MSSSQYPASLLERELLEQSDAIAGRAALADRAREAARAIADPSVAYLLIAARGSSDNAARFGQYLFGAEAGLSVALAAPSLFSDPDAAPDLRGAAVLGISQSGQSPDIVGVLAAARRQGRPTVAITNDQGSPLAEVADVVVPLATGPERSVAATKTYLASLHALVQIVEGLRPQPERRQWLERLPELLGAALAEQLSRRGEFDSLEPAPVLTVVGRGLDFSTAHETALKVRELAGMVTEPFSPADLMHGPVAAIRNPGALWLLDTHLRPDDSMAAVLALARERGVSAVVVSRQPPLPPGPWLHVAVPADVPDWVAAILAVLPGQVAAFHLADRRGVDLDHPHGLAKVTLTR